MGHRTGGRRSAAWGMVAGLCLLGAATGGAQEQRTRPERQMTIGGLVTAIAFAPEGGELLAWGPGGYSRWDVASGRRRGREPVFAKACKGLPVLPRSDDGRTIGANCGGSLHFFDLSTGKPLGDWEIPKGQQAAIYTASPDGRVAAVVMAGAPRVVDVRDLTGEGRDVAVDVREEVEQVSVAPGATRLIVGTILGVGVRHLPNDNLIRSFEGTSAHALSADGRTVAVVTGEGVVLHDIETGQRTRELKGRVQRVRFGAGDRLVVGWSNQTAIVWDAATGAQKLVLSTDEFAGAALSPDGTRVATVSLERRGGGASSVVATWRVPN